MVVACLEKMSLMRQPSYTVFCFLPSCLSSCSCSSSSYCYSSSSSSSFYFSSGSFPTFHPPVLYPLLPNLTLPPPSCRSRPLLLPSSLLPPLIPLSPPLLRSLPHRFLPLRPLPPRLPRLPPHLLPLLPRLLPLLPPPPLPPPLLSLPPPPLLLVVLLLLLSTYRYTCLGHPDVQTDLLKGFSDHQFLS